jgi:diacylglycerol kinase (ATP)
MLQVVNNYFSIGIDAKILHRFHTKREASPALFTSRTVNKMWYAQYGAKAILGDGCPLQPTRLRVEVDGKEIVYTPDVEGIILVNVPSWGSGTDIWGGGRNPPNPRWQPQSFSDMLIEAVCVTGSAHLAQIQGNLGSALRVAQGQSFRFIIGSEVYVQVDGEPWVEQDCIIELTHLEQAHVLVPADQE